MQSGPDQLRDWMARRGVTQIETARLCGIHPVFLSQILHGKRQPGLKNALRIERHTGIPAASWLRSEVSDSLEPVGVKGRSPNKTKR